MIHSDRQLPLPSADAWSFDLALAGGPGFVVLRLSEPRARNQLAQHLVDLAKAQDREAAVGLLDGVESEQVVVVW